MGSGGDGTAIGKCSKNNSDGGGSGNAQWTPDACRSNNDDVPGRSGTQQQHNEKHIKRMRSCWQNSRQRNPPAMPQTSCRIMFVRAGLCTDVFLSICLYVSVSACLLLPVSLSVFLCLFLLILVRTLPAPNLYLASTLSVPSVYLTCT